jgi:hypothetical protein
MYGAVSSGRLRLVEKEEGFTRATTRPLSSAMGTGPYARESMLLLALSPTSQTWPLGTLIQSRCACQPWCPVGSTQTTSPSRPSMRLHTATDGSRGDTAITTSPRSTHWGFRWWDIRSLSK